MSWCCTAELSSHLHAVERSLETDWHMLPAPLDVSGENRYMLPLKKVLSFFAW